MVLPQVVAVAGPGLQTAASSRPLTVLAEGMVMIGKAFCYNYPLFYLNSHGMHGGAEASRAGHGLMSGSQPWQIRCSHGVPTRMNNYQKISVG